jgi:AraC-like DNA-binding protein
MSWDGSVFIWRERILFVGKATHAESHAVPAIKLCAALEGKFDLNIGAECNTYSAAIIAAQTKHSMECQTKLIVLLYLLGESSEARELKHSYLANDNVWKIPDRLASSLLSRLGPLEDHREWDCNQALEVCENIISELIESPAIGLSEEVDDNVKRIIKYLYGEIEKQQGEAEFNDERFTPSAIIDELKLYEYNRWANEEKFKREFKKETGVRFSYYCDSLRLRAALGQLNVDPAERTNKDLTEIALSVGFSLNGLEQRFRKMLGINPSALRGNSRFLLCK